MSLILSLAVVIATVSAAEDPTNIKGNLLFYMSSLHISPTFNRAECLGYELIRYGYYHAKCGFDIDAQNDAEDHIWMWKKDIDLKRYVNVFYEYYIIPEGENSLPLWYMLLEFIIQYELFLPEKGHYTLRKFRRCTDSHGCSISLPERPRDVSYTTRQCQKVDLYLKELYFRLYKSIDSIIPYPLPFDYYSLGIYLLTNMPVSKDDLKGTNPKEKLFEFKLYLKKAFQKDKRLCEQRFIYFLWYRDRKEEFLEIDVAETADLESKKKFEQQLLFHKTVTNMMLQGWMMINGMTTTTGVIKLYDLEDKVYFYKVTDIDL